MKIDEITELYNINGPDFVKFVKENNLKYDFSYSEGVQIADYNVKAYVEAFAKTTGIRDFEKDSEDFSERDRRNKEFRERLEREAEEKRAKLEREAAKISEHIVSVRNMLVTSCPYLVGYEISEYRGLISGDAAISIDRGSVGIFGGGSTNVQSSLMLSLKSLRKQALQDLKEEAYELGCNAVIGVDFDYMTLEPETANYNGGTTYLPYVFSVTANGTAVIVEKTKKQKDDESGDIPEEISEEISEDFIPDL